MYILIYIFVRTISNREVPINQHLLDQTALEPLCDLARHFANSSKGQALAAGDAIESAHLLQCYQMVPVSDMIFRA
jgi:hypothetical protein